MGVAKTACEGVVRDLAVGLGSKTYCLRLTRRVRSPARRFTSMAAITSPIDIAV